MVKRNKLVVALIVNIVIVVFETVAVFQSVFNHKLGVFKFYTEDSNYLALVISAIFCVSAIVAITNKANIPKWVHFLRYTASVCLTLTFIVILCLLSPMYPDNFIYWMFTGSGIFHHTICPLTSFVSFVIFENYHKLKKKSIFLSLIPTIIYGITCIILNLTHQLLGPYPFFYVYALPWYVSTTSLIGVLVCTLIISFVLYKINNRKSRTI